MHETTVGKRAINDNSGEYLHLLLDPGSQNYCPDGLSGLEGEIGLRLRRPDSLRDSVELPTGPIGSMC